VYYTIDVFGELFIHYRGYQIITCKQCKFAVNPASVNGQIQSKHQTVTKAQRAQVAAFVDNSPQDARTPEDVITNRLRCVVEVEGQECNYT
jgi:hypothetical protein